MATFAYRAIDGAGHRRRGSAEAESPTSLRRELEAHGLLVLDVAPARDSLGTGSRRRWGSRTSVLELARALSALLAAAVPLPRALETAQGLVDRRGAAVLEEVRHGVARGEALHAALARFPALFSPLFVGVVRAGERSGDLAGAFARLANQLEREEQLRVRLLTASIYPLILATVGGAAVVLLLWIVLPRFVELLRDAHASLPRSTALLLAVSQALQAFWPFLLAGLGALAVAAAILGRTGAGRRAGSELLFRLPLIGPLRRNLVAARFARLLGVLYGGGAPLLSGLDQVASSVGDPRVRAEVLAIRTEVRAGATLHAAIGRRSLFPPLLAQLVAVGAESGRLQEFLLKAADIFEERTERMTQRLVALAEPAMIVVFGALVAFVALSLLQAIYSVNADAFR